MNPKKKKLVWWISGSVGLLLVVTVVLSLAFKGNESPIVEVEQVATVDKLVAKVTASGEIRPKQYVNLQSEIPGIVTQIYVKEGDHVKQGDVLLKIDPFQTEADARASRFQMDEAQNSAANAKTQIDEGRMQVRIAEANLLSAQADLEQAQANFEREQAAFKRKQQLHEQNLISKDDYDLARSTATAAKTRVDAAQARVREIHTNIEVSKLAIQQRQTSYQASMNRVGQYKASLDRAQNLLGKTVITSPITGVITMLKVKPGERAVPGTMDNPAATLMTIADLSVIETEVKVDETDIINVKLGQSATVKVDALPDKPLKGRVTEVGNSAINAGTTTGGSEQAKDFKVVVQLENPPESLRPGLSATTDITTATKNTIIAIPLQALVMREVQTDASGAIVRTSGKPEDAQSKGLKKTEKQGVFIMDKSSHVTFTPVETGVTGDTKIEILKGLKVGDTVVTGSFKTLRTLKDGDQVMPKKGGKDKDKDKGQDKDKE